MSPTASATSDAGADPDAGGTGSRDTTLLKQVAVLFGLGAVVILLDLGFQSVFGVITTTRVVPTDTALLSLAGFIPPRVLYGGITEELLLRWGLMSLVVWPL